MSSSPSTTHTPITFTYEQVSENVQSENRQFFEDYGQYLNHMQVYQAFKTSLQQKKSFSFCQSIINLKPVKIIKPCIFYLRCDLLLQIVEHYGLSIIIPEILEYSFMIALWSTKKETLPLFVAIVQRLPNHTQKFYRQVPPRESGFFPYSPYKNPTYETVYQSILKNMLETTLPVAHEGFSLLATKNFPINEQNRLLIQAYQAEPFFSMKFRLNRQDKLNSQRPQGIGCHDSLFSYLLSPNEIDKRKIESVKELMHHFQVPQQMFENICNYMINKTDKMIPDESEYRWISQFENKPRTLWFFNRFYQYDKMKFHNKIYHDLINDNEHQDDMTHSEQGMKI